MSTKAPLPVVVVGAGIIGACTALRLARDGRRVVLVDRLDPGEGCSFGNAGALSPAAVVPMALPGMLGKVPGWLRDPDGPLVVRPRYALRAAPWLLRWVRASRAAVVLPASDALNALNRGTLDGYRALLDAAQFADL
ncbi:MAG TPA: FAD-dependent oxidoreductase, partial [Casimicrobiaceae bacterium]|nr:FAD-dependent oxidoreductase [Casimicrobiaceae bacterium]